VWLDRTAHTALLDALGGFAESEAIHRAALPRFPRRLGADHYEVTVTLCNLGCVCAEQGKVAEAVRRLRRTLVLKERRFGLHHVEVAITRNKLANVVAQSRRANEAQTLLVRALAIVTRRMGRDHPSTRVCRANLQPSCRVGCSPGLRGFLDLVAHQP
jgi:hypothetical protein